MALYTYRIKHVRKLALKAILGKRLVVFEAWAGFALRCKVYRYQTLSKFKKIHINN